MKRNRKHGRTAAAAGDVTTRSTDCAHLHSAFGPGCPYCWTATTPAAGLPGARPAAPPPGKRAEAA
jgi:hypothetical protein